MGNHVDGNALGRDATSIFWGNRHMHFRRSVNVDVVTGFLSLKLRMNLLWVNEADDFFITTIADSDMRATSHHTRFNHHVRGFATH